MERREIEWIIKEKYKGKENKEIKKDLERLKKGEPVDYIIGFVNFLNCKIDLSFKPLIPRQETEFWVEKVIEEINNKRVYCLDLFSGSGCIGISILKNIKNSKVDFAEIDKKLLNQIELNLKINKIKKNRYNIFYSNIFSNVNEKYDYIFANPPYIAKSKIGKVQKSVLNFEPKKALFGGKNGLKYIKLFLKDAKNFLRKDGRIYLEFDSFQKKEIEKIEKKAKFYKDQYGKWRYLVIEEKESSKR